MDEGTKAFLKGRKPGLFVNFGQFPCYWTRIRIPNTRICIRIQDSQMNAEPDGSGSGSITLVGIVHIFIVGSEPVFCTVMV
jgi:hypothetical protein